MPQKEGMKEGYERQAHRKQTIKQTEKQTNKKSKDAEQNGGCTYPSLGMGNAPKLIIYFNSI